MPTELREYINNSKNLRDIESSTLSPEFGTMSEGEFNNLLSEAIKIFSQCRSKSNQVIFDRIENRISQKLSKIPNPTASPTADISNKNNDWYKKPLGIIALTVVGGVLVVVSVWVLNYYFNLGLG
jgi:hypothetical protein